ncbi:MarR family transcriptional regulator [Pseudomonas sp. KNUC1026]|uniref:MarR family transcriptional regulator n=1 Tax=Pseudomonas sp. KNUC1026 TaxID=2893890 RepID=UPI001F2DCF2A|nr:MarR family transcriptional regulator [Pseudomonas sp. KNUC1026]UFH49922.1 MarR family transcriptional regulator [Pseudomonas sp. KNUC1026]
MWTSKRSLMLKGQDILLLFKLASLHAREVSTPLGHPTKTLGGLTELDYLREDYASEQLLTFAPAAEEPRADIRVLIDRFVEADSLRWRGWDAVEDSPSEEAEPKWEDRYTLRALAESLGLSKSEISNSISRCRASGLITNDYETSFLKVNRVALLKITEHALKYFFPAKPGALARGIPTGFASPMLSKHLKSAGENIHVWPDPNGTERGQMIEPVYKTVPEAVKKDRTLYHYLALVDSIRMGGPREMTVAIQLLKRGMGF